MKMLNRHALRERVHRILVSLSPADKIKMTKTNILSSLIMLLGVIASYPAQAAPVVPGTGQKITQVGDDFEDPNWSFIHNFPKSSEEIDERRRSPTGKSSNGRWYEGIKRGQPDFMKVVPSPEDGLTGSQYSLMMRTMNSGIPGRRSVKMQQDDLIVNCYPPLRRTHFGIAKPELRGPSVRAAVRRMGRSLGTLVWFSHRPGNSRLEGSRGKEKVARLFRWRAEEGVREGNLLARYVCPIPQRG